MVQSHDRGARKNTSGQIPARPTAIRECENAFFKGGDGAQKKTRTSTPFRELAPEASASTNSAIWATEVQK